MILGLDDISGGTFIAQLLGWVVLTGLFYLVCYMALLNIIDDITKNHFVKIPVMAISALPSGFLMAIFNYKPFILFLLMGISNFYRIKGKVKTSDPVKDQAEPPVPVLFYGASYLYIGLVIFLAYYFQMPTDHLGETVPYWKTLFPDQEPASAIPGS